MKHIWLVYERDNVARNGFFIEQWQKAAAHQGVRVSLVLHEDLTYGMQDGKAYLTHQEHKELPDAAVMRLNMPLLSAHFERMGIPVFNNGKVARLVNDKRLTHQMMSGLMPCMDTVFLKGNERTSPLPYPVVLKAVHSCGGRQVHLINNDSEFQKALENTRPDEALVQACSDTPGRDVRVYVLGKDIIATMMRKSDEDFRSNIGQGGSAVPYEMNEDDLGKVRQIIDMFDFGLVGIDFIPHKGRLHFNEIEDAVGTRMLFANGHEDIVENYLKFILNKLAKN